MSKALIPCGTNVPAITTVLVHLYERYGIKEFVLFATSTSKSHAELAFENFRQLVGDEDVKYNIKVFDEPKWLRTLVE